MNDIMIIKRNDGKTAISNDLPNPQFGIVKLTFVHTLKRYFSPTPYRDEYKNTLISAGASKEFAELFIDRLSDSGEHENIDS